MNTDIRRLADLAGVTLTEHTLPPARAIRTTLTAVGLEDQDATVVESAVKIAVGRLSIDVSDYKVDRESGTIVVYPTITARGISAQQLDESKAELIQVLSSPSTIRRARGVSESADSKHPSEVTVARDLKARYGEADYSSKATGGKHKVIHDGNYYRSGMMRSKTLSGLLNLIDKKVNNKTPATGTMTIHHKGVKEGTVNEASDTFSKVMGHETSTTAAEKIRQGGFKKSHAGIFFNIEGQNYSGGGYGGSLVMARVSGPRDGILDLENDEDLPEELDEFADGEEIAQYARAEGYWAWTDGTQFAVLDPNHIEILQSGVKEGKEDLELYGLRIGNTVKADVDGRKVQGDVIDIFPETMEVELLLRGARAGKTVTVHVHDTEFLSEQRVRAGTVKENLNARAIKIPLEDVGLKDAAIADVQVYVDAAVEAQDVLDIDNWEIAHFTDLMFYCVGDEQPAAAKIKSFGKAMVAYLTDPENVNGAISATGESEKEECDEVEESLTEISSNLRDRYVDRATSAFGHYNMARRNTQGDEQKYFAHREERRRKGISRALSDKRLGREPANEGNRGDYGYPSFSVAKARELVQSGNWEAMSDIKPGRHVEMRNTRTGKRTTVQITESVARSNLGHTSQPASVAPKGGQYEAVHESHVTKSGTTNVFGYLDLQTGSTTLTHTVEGTLTEAAIKRHLEDVRFPLN